MIEGASWRRWVFFYVPLTAFIVGLLFPFYWMVITTIRPDSELYRPWNAPNYAPFWTTHPTLEHINDLLTQTLFTTWLLNTMIIALVGDGDLAVLRSVGRIRAVAFEIPVRRRARHRDLHHLSGTADPAVYSARRHHPQLSPRRLAVGPDPDLSDLFDPVLHLADDGLFQVHSQGARGMRPHRWRDALESDAVHHLPDRDAGDSVGRHLCLYLVVERVHLRARLPVLARGKDRAGRRDLRADPRRRVSIGAN